jgi:hypothetical protein
MGEGFSAVVRGAGEINAELIAMDARVNVATVASIKKVQSLVKSRVKGKMRGRPRWDRRGRSSRTGAEVNLHLNPSHISKSGGPGKLSGALSNSIRASKKPRPVAGGYSGVVMAGARGGPQNLYKAKVEETAPYFKPGVEAAKPQMPAIWNAAWAKAINTRR